jgi:hypothetical protein
MVDDMRFNYSDLNPDLIMDAIDLSGLRIDSGLIEQARLKERAARELGNKADSIRGRNSKRRR